MSLEITVYASDVRELDETIERAFDIRDEFGDKAVNENNEMETDQEIIGYADGTVHAVLQRQQELINKLHEDMQVIYDRNRGLEKEVNRIKDIIRKTSVVTNNINHSLFIEGDK
jgi:hypothetical protein